jgi:hypothetical protein
MLPDAYDAYVMWMAMKRHFTSKYDFIKYNGKVKASRESFEKKNFKKFLYALSTKYKQDLKAFLVAVYCRDGNGDVWCGELLEDKYHQEFLAREKRVQALTKTFKTDVTTIADFMEETGMSFRDVLVGHNGNLPPIIQLENKDLICPETVYIVHKLTGFLDKENVHPSWDDNKLRLTKLKGFIRIDDIGNLANVLRSAIG